MRYYFYKVNKAIGVLSDGSEIYLSAYPDYIRLETKLNSSNMNPVLKIWNLGYRLSPKKEIVIISLNLESQTSFIEIRNIKLESLIGRYISIGDHKGLVVWTENF